MPSPKPSTNRTLLDSDRRRENRLALLAWSWRAPLAALFRTPILAGASPAFGRLTRGGFFDGMRLRQVFFALGEFHKTLVVILEEFHLLFGEAFGVDQSIARPRRRRHQFVEFQMNGLRILVLS